MIDLGLLAQIKKAIAAKPRRHVTPAILLAVAMQESHAMPYFVDTKPGSQFSMNLHTAARITGIDKKTLSEIVTIKQAYGSFRTPAVMIGKLAKFRCEPSYWARNRDLEPLQRFIYSCSWGIFQFMAPNIVKTHRPEDIEFIRRFAADTEMQCLYAAGMIDDILKATGGNVYDMYRAYNSGNAHSKNSDVMQRASVVAAQAEQIQKYLDSRK